MLFDMISDFNHGWFVLHYLSVRCFLAALSAFFCFLFFGDRCIKYLASRQLKQVVRDDGPKSHLLKKGTPTMGGVLIFFAILIAVIIWSDLNNIWIKVLSLSMGLFAVVGFFDDWQKISKKSSAGLSAKAKLFWQFLIAIALMFLIDANITVAAQEKLYLPFVKSWSFDLGFWFIPFGALVIVSTSNAVNLTDGLDGLVILPVAMIAIGFGVFAYLSGNINFSNYLLIPYLPDMGEVSVFCAAIFGSSLGFLWFNAYPAQVFMGDVGSLSLGAVLGLLAVLVRQEVLLIIMGFVFVLEALSVIVQVLSYKIFKKRVFKMAPLHHHFELKGIPESKVIIRFWIVTIILVILSIATLKLR
jgi:phospho-N-acetylmuramoyl-pentapeptide-transferase